MSDKQVCELTIDDLGSYSVWFFPMGDTVENELTIRPLAEQETCSDFQIIVRADFLVKMALCIAVICIGTPILQLNT